MLDNASHRFDVATRVTPGDSRWQGHTSEDYWAFVGPFGGCTAATMLRAIMNHPQRAGDPTAVTVDGRLVPIPRVSVNYQSHADGGCANTDSRPDATGVAQWTTVTRTVAQGTVLAVPGSGAAAPVPSGP